MKYKLVMQRDSWEWHNTYILRVRASLRQAGNEAAEVAGVLRCGDQCSSTTRRCWAKLWSNRNLISVYTLLPGVRIKSALTQDFSYTLQDSVTVHHSTDYNPRQTSSQKCGVLRNIIIYKNKNWRTHWLWIYKESLIVVRRYGDSNTSCLSQEYIHVIEVLECQTTSQCWGPAGKGACWYESRTKSALLPCVTQTPPPRTVSKRLNQTGAQLRTKKAEHFSHYVYLRWPHEIRFHYTLVTIKISY